MCFFGIFIPAIFRVPRRRVFKFREKMLSDARACHLAGRMVAACERCESALTTNGLTARSYDAYAKLIQPDDGQNESPSLRPSVCPPRLGRTNNYLPIRIDECNDDRTKAGNKVLNGLTPLLRLNNA